MARKFEATQAYRHAVPLLIGIAGPPGAGKTMSALRLANGIKRHRGGPIVVIDTERSRALKYAPPQGVEANGVDHFDFLHVPFSPPFGSLDFLEAVMQQRAHRPSCIVIDSASEEHDGEGGMLDLHDAELTRMARDDLDKRERVGQAAWIKPKANRLKMINGYFQIMTPIIFAFRAREKTKQIKDDRGKQVPTNIGWTPIAPTEVVHAMDIFALLPIKSDGVPMWKGNTAYEDFSIKLPRQFQGLFPEGKQINEDMGYAMSVWALGDGKAPEATAAPAAPQTGAPAADRPTPAPADDFPGDRPAADVTTAPAESEPAFPVSEPSTETDAGTQDIGDDTGQPAGELALEPETATEPDSTDDGPQDHQIEESLSASAPAPDVGGFGECATAIAEAKDWPSIDAALMALRRSEAWIAASKATPDDLIRQAMIRRIAYVRLKELTDGGYRFDFVNDLQAWRCYIEWEEDLDALTGNRSAVHASQAWRAMDGRSDGTQAKLMLDRAYDARVVAIKAAAKASEYA